MFGRRALWLALLVLFAPIARAEEVKLLAVLPLDVTHSESKVSTAARVALEETLRDVAANTLRSSDWIVMTGENTLQILIDNGVDPTSCGDQSCHLGLARELKVRTFLSGSVLFVDGHLLATIRVVETRSGRLVGSERLTGANTTELQIAFEGRAVQFFHRCGLTEAKVDPPKPKERVTEPLSALEFVSRNGLWQLGSMVPVDAFSRCVWAGACFEPEKDRSERCNWQRRRSEPVNCIDAARARQFCDWMGGRLPTSGEWKVLGRTTGDLPAAFFEDAAGRGVFRFEGWRAMQAKPGEEAIDPEVGLTCVLAPERVAELP